MSPPPDKAQESAVWLSRHWRKAAWRWHTGPSCKGHDSKTHVREFEPPSSETGSPISDVKEGATPVWIRVEGPSRVSAISCDETGWGRGTFHLHALPAVPSPQKSAGLEGRSYTESWGQLFAVLHPPRKRLWGWLPMELFCVFCDKH